MQRRREDSRRWLSLETLEPRMMLAADLPANHSPAEQPLVMAPRLLELCFQTAGVWELGTQGRMALPNAI